MKSHIDHIFEAIDGQFSPRGSEDFRRSFHFTIYAIGVTVESALKALADTEGWGEIADIDWQPTDPPCAWYVRFTANGVSMKAAGEYVTGGVIVTWWK